MFDRNIGGERSLERDSRFASAPVLFVDEKGGLPGKAFVLKKGGGAKCLLRRFAGEHLFQRVGHFQLQHTFTPDLDGPAVSMEAGVHP